ncbi:MAG TPA: sigma 54-interacting transcriptional regulator [Clostridiales bacterium]|nr:sigma 54-interacting transcriptional regulator [Clostridiales bacterium]
MKFRDDEMMKYGLPFTAIFDKIAEAVYFCDLEGNLVYMNKKAEQLDGFAFLRVRGKSVAGLYGLDETTSPLLKALYEAKPVEDAQVTYYVNGREVTQLCNAAPLWQNGVLTGAYSIQRDITEMKQIIETNLALQWEVMGCQKKPGSHNARETAMLLIGESENFKRCKQRAFQAAQNDSGVFLVGDTGSGKELFARFIHDQSDRAKGPFLALNCAAIPEGLLEGILFGTAKGVYTGAVEREGLLLEAEGGTVFLDEINSMPLASQAKLLRVLEEKKVYKLGGSQGKSLNARIISSSNELPRGAVERGVLREDLFYRLSVVYIQIPPLKERREDIPLLVDYFLADYNQRFAKNVIGVADEVMAFFAEFSWPGNVRQLKHSIESAMNFTDSGQWIGLSALPPYLFEPVTAKTVTPLTEKEMPTETPATVMETIRDGEKKEIVEALKKAKGNMAQAARLLGMTRQAMVYRVKKYGLK